MLNDVFVDEEYLLSENTVILSQTDLCGNIVSYNQGFKLVSGYSDDELLGVNHRLLRHPDVPKQLFEDFWATLEANRPWYGILKNRRKDGRYYWVEASVTPYFDNGIKEGYISVRYPATREQVKITDDLFQNIAAGKASYKSSHRYANAKSHLLLAAMILLEVLVGFWLFEAVNLSSPSTIIMLTGVMLLLPMLQFMLFKQVKPTSKHRQSIEEICHGYYRSHLDDDDEWSFALNQIKGRVAVYAAQSYDQSAMLLNQTGQLTMQKKKAEAAVKAKANFLANMSHEIRTPMNAILGFTDLALGEQDINKVHQLVSKTSHASRLLLNIVNDILDFSKIESGNLVVVSRPYCLQHLVSFLENMFEGMAEAKGIEFSVFVDEQLSLCYQGDDFRLQQVMINLVGNAIKFTQKGGVRLEFLLVDNRLCFSVKDTGIGISQEHIDQLFSAFQQADDSITRKYGGTGLGLAISKRLVELMGGDGIQVESEIGVGSVFRFNLPLCPCSVDEQATLQSGFTETQQSLDRYLIGNILVVDDNEMNLEIARALLSQMGLSVKTVASGALAIEEVKAAKANDQLFDVILMDIQMPELDGFETTKLIHSLHPQQSIIALTAAVFGEDIEKAKSAGMIGHLAKPIDKQNLYHKLLPLVKTQKVMVSQDKSSTEVALDTPSNTEQRLVLDFQSGLEMLNGDKATYKMLIGMLLEQVLPDLEVLFPALRDLAVNRESLSDSEYEQVRKKLHAVKSPIASIFAYPLSESVEFVYHQLRSRESLDLSDIETLEAYYHQTLDAVTQWLKANT